MKLTASSPQSVQRIFGILDLLSRSANGETLSSIARHLGAPKNSIVGLLAGMLEQDHVARDESAVYRLGPAMLALSLRIAGGMHLRGLVRPALERLRDATGETALAGTMGPGPDRLTYIEKAESTSPMRYTVPVGAERELHCTATGKLMLAFMPPREQLASLQRLDLVPMTQATITSLSRLKAQLRTIRRTGIASSHDERIAGASAIAAAVIDAEGQLLLALTIVGPSARMQPHAEAHTAALVREAAQLSELVAHAGGALTLQP